MPVAAAADFGDSMPPTEDLTQREKRQILQLVEAGNPPLAEKLAERLEGRDERLIQMFREVLNDNSESMRNLAKDVTSELRSFRNAAVILAIVVIVAIVSLAGGAIAFKGFGIDVGTRHQSSAQISPAPEAR